MWLTSLPCACIFRRPMTIDLYEMRVEEALAHVAAVRSEKSVSRRVRLAETFLSDPALPRAQREEIRALLRESKLGALRPSSMPPLMG